MLADFGVGKSFKDDWQNDKTLKNSTIIGTPCYFSPEMRKRYEKSFPAPLSLD
jgi:serine/threonine protein kinase